MSAKLPRRGVHCTVMHAQFLKKGLPKWADPSKEKVIDKNRYRRIGLVNEKSMMMMMGPVQCSGSKVTNRFNYNAASAAFHKSQISPVPRGCLDVSPEAHA